MMMQETLSEIGAWLAEHRSAYYALLQPPASAASLAQLEACVDAPPPDDFLALYRWHDGQDPQSSSSFVGNQMFLSSYDVVDIKTMLDDMIGYDFEDPETWRRGWVPFLSNGGGSYLCLDMEARAGQVGQLVEFWKGDEDRPIAHASIADWAQQILASMRDGSFETF